MKFKFYEKESKLYDLLQLPRIVFLFHNEESYGKEENIFPIEKLENEQYVEHARKAYKKLLPLKEEIHVFYANEFLSSYDLFVLLTHMYTIFGYGTIDEYIDSILKHPEDKIKHDLIYALLSMDSDDSDKEELKQKAEQLMNKQGDLMQFVKDLPTESSYKWNVLMFLDNPVKMIKQFYTLMKQLEPIFEGLYQEKKEEVFACKRYLEELFSKNTVENFKKITHFMVSEDLMEEENHMLISFVFAYSFVDRSNDYGTFFVWGLEMEEGFDFVSKRYGNQIEKRTKVFKILGDKTRYEVLKLLASGITSTKEIAKQLGVTSATISYHINSFVTNNVVKLSKSSKRKYDVDFDVLDDIWTNFMNDLKGEK
jgi:DNA-binding transcriptional ArsR family regulator